MSTSRVPCRRGHRCLAVFRLSGWALVLAAAAGCARLAVRPPEPPAARRTVAPAGAGTPAASTGTTVVAGGPTATPTPPPTPNRDPAEEITPEELAAISEPIPGSQSVPGRAGAGKPAGGAQGSSQAQSTRPESLGPRPTSLWRVQIFVTQDRDLANRKAREAAERLQVKAHVEFESPNYKVRLGDYRSEGEAQPLRDRAVFTGYPGAFRVRCDAGTSYELD
ncbi:MAG: SPOR domain-containing protein [Candidatus Eisenbacteria bacterium]|uniref:SPOR domain-containing protein n=1 Tax=Eiseniibacteriota bacterium TaxID=2212470 RepID=A0A538SUV4_UNCEI|nr:MAG: SPOR domain-containing protein [Candidatus Eisenbacteria bacterium]